MDFHKTGFDEMEETRHTINCQKKPDFIEDVLLQKDLYASYNLVGMSMSVSLCKLFLYMAVFCASKLLCIMLVITSVKKSFCFMELLVFVLPFIVSSIST
jgi:hypothetical protein